MVIFPICLLLGEWSFYFSKCTCSEGANGQDGGDLQQERAELPVVLGLVYKPEEMGFSINSHVFHLSLKILTDKARETNKHIDWQGRFNTDI